MMAICTLPASSSISVQFSDGTGGRMFRRGDVVDLDAEATPGQTWRQAFGQYADAFTEQGDQQDFWGDDGPVQE